MRMCWVISVAVLSACGNAEPSSTTKDHESTLRSAQSAKGLALAPSSRSSRERRTASTDSSSFPESSPSAVPSAPSSPSSSAVALPSDSASLENFLKTLPQDVSLALQDATVEEVLTVVSTYSGKPWKTDKAVLGQFSSVRITVLQQTPIPKNAAVTLLKKKLNEKGILLIDSPDGWSIKRK